MKLTIRIDSRSTAHDDLRVYIGTLDQLHNPLDRSTFPQNWIVDLGSGIVTDERLKVDVLDLILVYPQATYPPLSDR